MAQADTVVVDNGTGQSVRGGFNSVAAAALTLNSGTTPPPDPAPGMPWWNPTGRLAIRSDANTMWLFWWSFLQDGAPGAQNNEAAGYPAGATWTTAAGGVYHHRGGGVWFEAGTGGGSGGGGGGIFLNFLGVPRMIDTDIQPALGIDTSGILRMVDDGT